MATIDDLHHQGHLRIRLPWWNKHAYAELYEVPSSGALGPWVRVYDVLHGIGGGEPIELGIWDADKHDEWVPADLPSTRPESRPTTTSGSLTNEREE